MANLPVWPPAELSDESRESLLEWAVDWALGHSLVLRPADSSRLAVIHAPFSLLPTPFKSHAFIVAKSLQPAYNDLYANIAASPGFLHQTLAPLARVDSFQAGLYEVYKKTYEQTKDQFTLGLFRSDYLLHSEDGLPKQVEFNTVSSSFGPLSTRVSQMHREAALAGLLPDCIKLEQLPPNEALDQLADGLAAAHKLFNKPESVVLMVVQEGERNAFDQRLLEFSLLQRYCIFFYPEADSMKIELGLDRHGIRCVRRSFQELASLPAAPSPTDLTLSTSTGAQTVSVVYYRAGYGPSDYPSDTEWQTRLKLELTTAIKCPSVGLQLAGAKKVQQVLATNTSLLARFLSPQYKQFESELRKTFMGIWPLDQSEAGQEALRLARHEPDRFVMKPQREGGGNNIYRQDIPRALDGMKSKEEVESYILMELIKPPPVSNIMVRGGTGEGMLGEVISELGCYGVALFRQRQDGAEGADVRENKYAGHLLRTKGATDDEGGVAVGFSVIDSPLLVD